MSNGNGNGGIVKPVTETVKALAGTPMLLVLLVMNVLVLGMVTYLLKVRGAQISAERTELVEALNGCIKMLDNQQGQP